MQPANKKNRSILPEVADAANILAANLAWIGNSNAYFGQTSSGSSFMHSSSEIECNTSPYLTHSNSYADFNCLYCWTICYVSTFLSRRNSGWDISELNTKFNLISSNNN